MKLLSHSNGLYKLDKEKISKIKILKRCAIFLVALLAIGFLIQSVNNLIDNSKLKSRFKYVRLDGKKVDQDKTFENGLMFPGDPNGRPEETWNCRCAIAAVVKGFKKVKR